MSTMHENTILGFVKPKPANAKQLASILSLSESRTSEICRELVKAGKLATVKQGNTFLYALPGGKSVLPATTLDETPAPPSGKLGAALLETTKKGNAVKKKATTKPKRKANADKLLDTSSKKRKKKEVNAPDVAGRQKPSGKDERIRSVNGSQARLDALKAYVKQEGGWTMSWGGKLEGWQFRKGSTKKSCTSQKLAEYDGPGLMRFLNR